LAKGVFNGEPRTFKKEEGSSVRCSSEVREGGIGNMKNLRGLTAERWSRK